MNRINECIYRTRKKQNVFSIMKLCFWICFMVISNFFALLYLFKIEFQMALCVILLILNIGIFYEGGSYLKDIYFFMKNQGFYFKRDTDLLTYDDIEKAVNQVKKIKEYRRNRAYFIKTSEHILIINFKSKIISLSDIENVKTNYEGQGRFSATIIINEKKYTYYCYATKINNAVLLELMKYRKL